VGSNDEKGSIFVLGLDQENLAMLERVPDAVNFRFHQLLTIEELQVGDIPIADLLRKAEDRLTEHIESGGTVDAVVGYWDFPVSTMSPILRRRFGSRGPSLESVLKCEHKYWSRLEQRDVASDLPRFALVDLDQEPVAAPADVGYPMWLKPVKSFSSDLAFEVTDDEEFTAAANEIRAGVDRVGEPFQYLLDQVELPAEIAEAGGRACVAEQALSGQRAAVEGFAQNGRVTIYGILDSLVYPGNSSFLRHQYPSTLPEHMLDALAEVSTRVIERIGFDDGTFSIEFFCDPDTGSVSILEINPRHSQAHAELFWMVDGVPNHHCMLNVALGRDPRLPHREGEHGIAARWYLRRFTDGVVRVVPDAEELRRLTETMPGVAIEVLPQAGTRLSELPAQDSYSYELAELVIGARDEEELQAKYDRCVQELNFRIEDV
jgi:biotin carboxylase